MSGTSVIRIARGKVAEQWVIWDTLGMMQQLGMISPLSHTAGANG